MLLYFLCKYFVMIKMKIKCRFFFCREENKWLQHVHVGEDMARMLGYVAYFETLCTNDFCFYKNTISFRCIMYIIPSAPLHSQVFSSVKWKCVCKVIHCYRSRHWYEGQGLLTTCSTAVIHKPYIAKEKINKRWLTFCGVYCCWNWKILLCTVSKYGCFLWGLEDLWTRKVRIRIMYFQ
jgi:hypothetical protein